MWERHGKEVGELTRYADDVVVVCRTKKDALHALKLIQAIMKRLELTLHPEKKRIVGLWAGEEGFDFLGMHHRKTKVETSQNRLYYTTQQWPCTKAKKHIREVVKERLAPPKMWHISFQGHVNWLNLRIQGWKNYYATPHSTKWMTRLDWYIYLRLTKWYAKKRQRNRLAQFLQ